MGLIRITLINSKHILRSPKFATHMLYKFMRDFHKCPVNYFPRSASTYKDSYFRSNKSQLENEFPDGNVEPILESSGDIFGIESDEGAICFDDATPSDLEKLKSSTGHKEHEVVCVTSFGQIRRDIDNPPRVTFKSRAYNSYLQSGKRIKQNQNAESDAKLTEEKSKVNQLTTRKEAYALYSKLADQQDSYVDKSNGSPIYANISDNEVGDTTNIQQSGVSELDNTTHSASHPSDHLKVQYSGNMKSKLNKRSKQIVTKNFRDDSVKESVSKNLSENNFSGQLNNSNYFDECYFGDQYNDDFGYTLNFNNLSDVENRLNTELPITKNNIHENVEKSSFKDSTETPHDDHVISSTFNNFNHDRIGKELTVDDNYIDKQYFGDLCHDEKYDADTIVHTLTDVRYPPNTELAKKEDKYRNRIEKTPIKQFSKVSQHEHINKTMLSDLNADKEEITGSSSYIDKYYFGDQNKEKSSSNLKTFKYSGYNKNQLHAKPNIKKNDYESFKEDEQNMVQSKLHFKNKSTTASTEEVSEKFGNIIKSENSVVKQEKNLIKKDKDKIGSAMDYVMKLKKATQIRSSVIKDGDFTEVTGEILDSKGFRVLKNQVPDLSKLTREELLTILKNRVLYENEDVVVLNKPYNMVVHDGKTNKDPNLSSLLDDLARMLDKKIPNSMLFTVHRLDKETTGCILLARNEKTAQYLKSLFVQRKILKTYWVVTSRVPDPMEGIIDIPITEGSIDNKTRMVLNPIVPKDVDYRPHVKHGKRAVTHYKVISVSGNAALVEVKPETGIKHQIRVHFGFGLNCPIIGDHKYSHLDKLAPQKLPSDLLQRLHVRQSKVRHIPMHIHARSIVIPQMLDGRSLFAYAPLPIHMAKNLQRLKFRKK